MTKPRWKVMVELLLAIALTLLGANMAIEGMQGELAFGALAPWVGVAVGSLMCAYFVGRIVDRWQEL